MPNQHKNPAVSWHPADSGLKDRIKAEAGRQGTTASRILDESVTGYLDQRIDPDTPAWVLDVAETVIRRADSALIDAMFDHGEDVTRTDLWRHRKSQFRSLIASRFERAPGAADATQEG